jgi:hypothetical protein
MRLAPPLTVLSRRSFQVAATSEQASRGWQRVRQS